MQMRQPKVPVIEKQEWSRWVTPSLLTAKPIHRWFTFPHSYTSELVHALVDDWKLGSGDVLLDPFAGAGTSLLSAKERGIRAVGFDISPLAVFASSVKIANYEIDDLNGMWVRWRSLDHGSSAAIPKEFPSLIKQALAGKRLERFSELDAGIGNLDATDRDKAFLRLALLRVLSGFSFAVASGGWLKWVEDAGDPDGIQGSFERQVELMLADVLLSRGEMKSEGSWTVNEADARAVPLADESCSAVITSPPYPNRHDYTRVFGVELMFGFLDWAGTRKVRYQSFHSHPESRPARPQADEYRIPATYRTAIDEVRNQGCDARVVAMLEGYGLDMYICLREMKRVCRPGAKIALVVGNAQYAGVPIAVDECTVALGKQLGLVPESMYAARYRGNSAQQMAMYGRRPSRESVVVMRKPRKHLRVARKLGFVAHENPTSNHR